MHIDNTLNLPNDAKNIIAREKAPLRIQVIAKFAASPQKVFAVVGDLEAITRFMPMIKHASVHHSLATGCVGKGSERVCSMPGMGEVNEKVVWWDSPSGYAYRASGSMVPMRDHLGVFVLTSDTDGGTRVEWRHHFHTRFGPLGWMFPFMMKRMMRKAFINMGALMGVHVELA